jgi:probable rRNA maturation factor
MIEVVNRQRKLSIDCERWEAFAGDALRLLPTGSRQEAVGRKQRAGHEAGGHKADVTIAFVSDRSMRELNRMWRHKQGTTDVLSFPAEPDEFETNDSLGDVVISVEQATRQAKENGLTFDGEIAQLILHGVLHLCGYDHETDKGEMNKLELRLRRKLRI